MSVYDRPDAEAPSATSCPPTPSWTTLGLWIMGDLGVSKGLATWYLRADNLTDELAYAASSVATVRGLAPLPGRSLSLGVRLTL